MSEAIYLRDNAALKKGDPRQCKDVVFHSERLVHTDDKPFDYAVEEIQFTHVNTPSLGKCVRIALPEVAIFIHVSRINDFVVAMRGCADLHEQDRLDARKQREDAGLQPE